MPMKQKLSLPYLKELLKNVNLQLSHISTVFPLLLIRQYICDIQMNDLMTEIILDCEIIILSNHVYP